MAVTVEGFKCYLVDPPDDDTTLELYLNSAKSAARAAGVPDYKNNAEYDLFLYALAASRYDNRGLGYGGSYVAAQGENEKAMINSFVLRLRHAGEDVSSEDTGEGSEA